LGLLLAIAYLSSDYDQQVGGEGFISQEEFEQCLLMPPVAGKPCVTSIVIRRAGPVDLVTLELLNPSTMQYQSVRLASPRPYLPKIKSDANARRASIVVYLSELRAKHSGIAPKYVWWDEWWAVLSIGAIGGSLVGSMWSMLFRKSLSLSPETHSLTTDCHQASDDKECNRGQQMTDADVRQLEELEAEMVAALNSKVVQASSESSTPEPTNPRPTAVRPLAADQSGEQEVVPATPRRYAGEYYPVAKNIGHGFTLLELLVAIGIIALLIAIFLPVASLVREHAHKTQCANNLRQVGAALELYNQTHQALPLIATAQGLSDALTEVRVTGIMRCPDDAPGTLSYVMNGTYVGLPKSQGNASEPLAYEMGVGHQGQSNTVFFDGHVDSQPRASQ